MPSGSPERLPLIAGGAILLGAAIIALSIAFTFRWSVAPNARISSAVVLDRWTGEVSWCFTDTDEAPGRMKCGQK